jgi:hypothetical protein
MDEKEELKSVEIWKCKQSWLERYEEVYDSRNIFRKEENTLVEYNNRRYNYNQNTRRQNNSHCHITHIYIYVLQCNHAYYLLGNRNKKNVHC